MKDAALTAESIQSIWVDQTAAPTAEEMKTPKRESKPMSQTQEKPENHQITKEDRRQMTEILESRRKHDPTEADKNLTYPPGNNVVTPRKCKWLRNKRQEANYTSGLTWSTIEREIAEKWGVTARTIRHHANENCKCDRLMRRIRGEEDD